MTEREEAVLHFQWLKKRLCEEWQKFIPKDSIAYMASKREEHYYDMAISALSENKAFEGMTNGEVVKAVFPSFTVEVNSDWVACWIDPHDTIGFDKDWWNAPYKGVSE